MIATIGPATQSAAIKISLQPSRCVRRAQRWADDDPYLPYIVGVGVEMAARSSIAIPQHALSQATEVALQLSSQQARERVLVSQAACLTVRDHFERRHKLHTEDGRSAQTSYAECLDIADFRVNDWYVEIRAVTPSAKPGLLIPTMPLMVGVLSDFYVSVQTDASLSNIKLLGYARRSEIRWADLSGSGLFIFLPPERLTAVNRLGRELGKPRVPGNEYERLFQGLQARADRIIGRFSEILSEEGKLDSNDTEYLIERLRDDVMRVYGGNLRETGIEPLLKKLFHRFRIERVIPEPPDSPVLFDNAYRDRVRYAISDERNRYFGEELQVSERVALYRFLLKESSALEEHRRITRRFDVASSGSNKALSYCAPDNEGRILDSRAPDTVVAAAELSSVYGPAEVSTGVHGFAGSGDAIDFSADPDIVRAVAEAERLGYGHQFSPAFAIEVSQVDPLPHQYSAVHQWMLPKRRLRFVLADEDGTGKSVTSGLYIREMISRRRIDRVLVVTERRRVGHWRREMRGRFGLYFEPLSSDQPEFRNPFVGSGSDLLILSVDDLDGKQLFERLREFPVVPYDLVVFDRAHLLLTATRQPGQTVRETSRYRFAEAISGSAPADAEWRLEWSCRHLLMLSARSNLESVAEYWLWRILDPEALPFEELIEGYPRNQHMVARSRQDIVDSDGSPVYSSVRWHNLRREVLANQICGQSDEEILAEQWKSKLIKLRDVLLDARFYGAKAVIFAEQRAVRSLLQEMLALGFVGKVAHLDAKRDEHRSQYSLESPDAHDDSDTMTYFIACDADAGDLNIGCCDLVINFDVPQSLDQLKRRINSVRSYGCRKIPVSVVNLIAGGSAREEAVWSLIERLAELSKEKGIDRAFELIGIEAMADGSLLDPHDVNASQIDAPVMQRLDRSAADELAQSFESSIGPGYVRCFLNRAAALSGMAIEENNDGRLRFRAVENRPPGRSHSTLQTYTDARVTLHQLRDQSGGLWLRPGEPFFEKFREQLLLTFSEQALNGAVFVDPDADTPYFFHVVVVAIEYRGAGPNRTLQNSPDERFLIGLRQDASGLISRLPVEHLLMLKNPSERALSELTEAARRLATDAWAARERARKFALETLAPCIIEVERRSLLAALAERERSMRRVYNYAQAELAGARAHLSKERRNREDLFDIELQKIRNSQRELSARIAESRAALRREPELIKPGSITFVTHALVVPSTEVLNCKHSARTLKAAAISTAGRFEEKEGRSVTEASAHSSPIFSGRQHRGFDLLSLDNKETRAIAVKARNGIGDVDLTENEMAQSGSLTDRYWIYVVYDSVSDCPLLLRLRNPFKYAEKVADGGLIRERDLLMFAERD